MLPVSYWMSPHTSSDSISPLGRRITSKFRRKRHGNWMKFHSNRFLFRISFSGVWRTAGGRYRVSTLAIWVLSRFTNNIYFSYVLFRSICFLVLIIQLFSLLVRWCKLSYIYLSRLYPRIYTAKNVVLLSRKSTQNY